VKMYYLAGPFYVIISTVVIFGGGLVFFLALSIDAVPEHELRSEFNLEEGGVRVENIPDTDYHSVITIRVEFWSQGQEDGGISLLFVDEDSHRRFMEELEEGNVTTALEKINDLEFIYRRTCTRDTEFEFKLGTDDTVHLIIMNNGNRKGATLVLETTTKYDAGGCFVVFLVFSLISALVVKAVFQMEGGLAGKTREDGRAKTTSSKEREHSLLTEKKRPPSGEEFPPGTASATKYCAQCGTKTILRLGGPTKGKCRVCGHKYRHQGLLSDRESPGSFQALQEMLRESEEKEGRKKGHEHDERDLDFCLDCGKVVGEEWTVCRYCMARLNKER